MSYHRFSLDCYILVYILLYKNNISIPDKIANYIEKSLEFIMFSIKPNGECPYFGDSDNARPLFLSFYDYKQYSGSLALGAVLFNRGDMKWVAKCFHEEALWLLGVGSIDKFRSIKGTPPSEGSKAFPDGGYYIMRSSWDDEANYMFFDCGPLGLGRASSHGHADALSFELYCGGRSVFVDPGTYVYNANRKWRDYFRSTMAHNTATVDSRNQSVIKSRMEWEGSANATVNRWITCEHFDVIDAQHDGYTHLKNPVIHRRIVFFNKQRGYWVIKDLFIGKGEHTFSVNYHCRPDENIRQESNNFFLTRKNSEILLTVTGEKEIKTKVVMGQKEPIMGWYSEGYGEKVPAPVINIEWQGTTPTSLLSFISPYQGGDVGAQINCIIGGKLSNHTLSPLAVEVKRNGLSDVIIILDEDKCSFENNDILFEGELLHFSKSTDNIKNIFFSNAYSINISGRNVLNSTTPKSNFSKNEN